MHIKGNGKEERLQFVQDLYTQAKNHLADEIENMDRHNRQYLGSREIDGSHVEASVVRNITYELIESQVSSHIPSCQCRAGSYSAQNDRCAKSMERYLNMQRDRLPFERINDMDERYTYIYGGSPWLVEWDETVKTHYTSGNVAITLISPQDFFPQPYIYEKENLEYFFARFLTSKDEIKRKYGATIEELDQMSVESDTLEFASDVSGEDGEGELATVVVLYYKDNDGNVGRFVFSGEVVLSDVRDYYARRKRYCKVCGRNENVCSCEEPDIEEEALDYEELDHDIVGSDGNVIIHAMSEVVRDDGTVVMEEQTVTSDASADGLMSLDADGLPMPMTAKVPKMQPTRIPYYKPKTLPIVIRRNTSQDKKLFGQSDCEFIRDQQQLINKIESRIHDKLMRASVTACIPEGARIQITNDIFGEALRLQPGNTKNDVGVIDTTPNISQDIAQADRVAQHARYTLGISRSYQGQEDTTAKSGVAKQAQIAQSQGRLDSKRRMKGFAYSELDRIIFEYTLAFADEPRPVAFKDEFGMVHNDMMSRYDFVRRDEDNGKYYYDDDYIFSPDESGGLEEQRAVMWEMNLQNLQSGTFGNPQDPSTLLMYWRKQEKAHYPNAHENVMYFQEIVKAQRNAAIAQQGLNAAASDPNAMAELQKIMQGGMTNA